MESAGETRRHRFDSCRFNQREDSSVGEQMTCNHRDAGSNPAPTLRFSLQSWDSNEGDRTRASVAVRSFRRKAPRSYLDTVRPALRRGGYRLR